MDRGHVSEPEKAVMTTGMGVLSLKFLVLSLKDLQNSIRFRPCSGLGFAV